MSGVQDIRQALETALNGMSPALSTAWENQAFTPPVVTTAYQEAVMMFARPDNQEFGSTHQELGYLQIRLMYPLGTGSATANARAELIRTTFQRGLSFTDSGVTVNISDTPEVMPGSVDRGRWAVVVKVRFFSNIT